MELNQTIPFLKDERKKTDDSLVAERLKTNESFNKTKSTTERQTDKKVQNERLQTDQATSVSRETADFDSNKKRNQQGFAKEDEKEIGCAQLVIERDQSDRAIELERTRADLAMENERELKSAMASQMLEQERKLTDKNLSTERTKTDTEVERWTGLLSDEISEHSKTKVSLTTRDEFLAIVSHDLKNPIGAASMCVEMLLDDPAFQKVSVDARNSMELIKRNIDTSLRLIADLLDMERIECGKLSLMLKGYPINQIIQEAAAYFAHIALAKKVVLRTMSSGFSGDVFCDKDRVMQVLSNLIGNALKFTPEGGSITLGASLIEGEIQFSVCDTGPGIPEEKRLKIFERYAQLGVKDRVGLGLGLYISKMLIEAHQGKLWVSSKVGDGSTFHFTIPGQTHSPAF